MFTWNTIKKEGKYNPGMPSEKTGRPRERRQRKRRRKASIWGSEQGHAENARGYTKESASGEMKDNDHKGRRILKKSNECGQLLEGQFTRAQNREFQGKREKKPHEGLENRKRRGGK